jgi:hypothetical protein
MGDGLRVKVPPKDTAKHGSTCEKPGYPMFGGVTHSPYTQTTRRGNVVAVAVRGSGLLPPLLLLSALAGCRDSLTQVVVVLQSDLVVPTETDGVQTAVVEGPLPPGPNSGFGVGLTSAFPLAFGVTSGGITSTFSFTVQLTRGFNSGTGLPLIVVNRTVSDIRFVDEQTMMLVVPLLRACACQGTSCPSPGNPMCDAIDRPALLPFDPAVAPPSVSGSGLVFSVGNPPS